MAFTVEDFQDLIKLLAQHPEWRAELRRHVLSDDFVELPVAMRQLAEAVAVLTGRVDALVEAQIRTDARIDALVEAQIRTEARIDALVEAQIRTEARIDVLVMAQASTESTLRELVQRQDRTDDRLGHLEGRALESDFERNGPAYLGPIARRLRVIEPGPLADLLDDAVDDGRLTFPERDAIMRSDVVLTGRRRDDGQEVYLLVEASVGVRPYDVERAVQRAALLSKLGRPALPVVAGHRVHRDAAQLAQALGAWTAEDGQITPPPGR